MILKDIRGHEPLDISTISRVANSQICSDRIWHKALKRFLPNRSKMKKAMRSQLFVVKILSEMIIKESKRKPLSDEKLKELLLRKGYNIAGARLQNIVEQLNIPVARLRKELV